MQHRWMFCPPQHLFPHFWTSNHSISWPGRCTAEGTRTNFHLLLKGKKKKKMLPFNIWFCQFKNLRSCSCKSRIHLTEHRTHFPMQSHPELLDMPAEDRQVSYTAHGNQEILVIIALNRDAPDSHHKWMCLHSPKPSRHPAETELTHSMEKNSSFNPKVPQTYVKFVTSQNHLFLSWV